MSFEELVETTTRSLREQGLEFVRVLSPDKKVSVMHPKNWATVWRNEYVAITHGDPPAGWLSLYPTQPEPVVSTADLVEAFLDQVVEPSTGPTRIQSFAQLDRCETIEAAEFTFERGKRFRGMALGQIDKGQGRVAGYWVEDGLFRRRLVEDLLIVVLGAVEATAESSFAPGSPARLELSGNDIWPASTVPVDKSFGAKEGRFAMSLPAAWTVVDVAYEGEQGWLICPPGPPPGQPGAPLITISGADLIAPLETTLRESLTLITEQGCYQLEVPPAKVALGDQEGLVQLWSGTPPDAPGSVYYLWSLGVTDKASVVHLLAVLGEDSLLVLLPALATIGRHIQVLPRVLNTELMKALTGRWRYLDAYEDIEEVAERRYRFREDGTFACAQRTFKQGIAVGEAHETDTSAAREMGASTPHDWQGTWDAVGSTLTMIRDDGTREMLEVDSVADSAAIIGKVFWERI